MPFFQEKFWRYTTERFLYLNDFLQKFPQKNVFHLEYDNMLYVDLEELLPVLEKHYLDKIGMTLDFDDRAIGGFLYFNNPNNLQQFAKFLIQ